MPAIVNQIKFVGATPLDPQQGWTQSAAIDLANKKAYFFVPFLGSNLLAQLDLQTFTVVHKLPFPADQSPVALNVDQQRGFLYAGCIGTGAGDKIFRIPLTGFVGYAFNDFLQLSAADSSNSSGFGGVQRFSQIDVQNKFMYSVAASFPAPGAVVTLLHKCSTLALLLLIYLH